MARKMKIDESDRKIMGFLSQNARMPVLKMSREMNITEAAIRKRLKKLQKYGVIKGYEPMIHPEYLGFKCHAFIGFDAKKESFLSVIDSISKLPEVKKLFTSAGEHSGVIEVWLENNEKLSEFIEQKMLIEGIEGIYPSIVLERIK